jgi:hypothetical protein
LSKRINPNLDEGISGDPKAMQLAEIRARIRKLIEGAGGYADWSKANELGKKQIPRMAAQTIIRFAYGDTLQPAPWTIKTLSKVVRYKVLIVPEDVEVPGSFDFE